MSGERELVTLLTKKGYTITTAESCTGGMLSAAIVNVEGASNVLNSAFVTYANEAKMKYAHVLPDTLEKWGAVSEETAREMCRGSAEEAEADVALSTTGIAGPDGGTKEKPVGLVYIGCYVKGDVFVEKHIFAGSRADVRRQTVKAALDFAIQCISKE